MNKGKVIFTNEVNVRYIFEVMCDLLTRQSGGELIYEIAEFSKKEVKNEKNEATEKSM